MNSNIFPVIGVCVLSLFFSVSGSFPATARATASYCEGIESTAEILTCTNRHNEDAQIRLNMVFTELLNSLSEEEEKEHLQQSQEAWLAYRDRQCAFEKSRADKPGFERIYEISCLALMTDQRTEKLSMSLFSSGNGGPTEFGELPRWMNVLAHQNPDVFWLYGKRQSGDINCDGADEEIISGVRIESGLVKPVVAVAENPVVGKPQVYVLPVDGESARPGEKPLSCSLYLTVDFIEVPRDGESEEGRCDAFFSVSRENCENIKVYRSGSTYDLSPEPGS